METTTQFKPNLTDNPSLMNLPILKHFNQDELKSSMNKMTGGAKGIFGFLKLALIGGFAWAAWTYVLPPIMKAVGITLGVGAAAALILLFIVIAPSVFKWFKVWARKIDKAAINRDPFLELEKQRGLLIANQQTFRVSKGNIAALKQDMEVESKNSETEATTLQNKIVTLRTKVQTLKTKLDEMVAKGGVEARNSDEFVDGNALLAKMLSEANRVTNQLAQCKDFVQKYGSRAAIMKKFGQKMVMAETAMEIKLADYDVTVEMLKKDYEFARKSRAATDAAKSALMFTKTWELEYAMDVVASTIASDIAITAGNLRDIDSLTSKYSLDNDELYTNLNILADNIKTGADEVPSAKQYSNPEYKLTSDDKLKTGGFGNLDLM